MGEEVIIDSGDAKLEGELFESGGVRAGLVCHPHPLYGGSMHNNVVQAAAQGLTRAGWTSLTFNFRGVGGSTGKHGGGESERDDVAAAAAFLKGRGSTDLLVVGYSFGAWAAAFAWPKLKDFGVRPLVLIAPPAAFMSFDGLAPETRIGLMVCGEYDDIAPPDLAEALGGLLTEPVVPLVVKGTDHFFGGREAEISRILADYIQ